MYINDLGMRHEVNVPNAASTNTVNTKTSSTGTTNFPTELKSAVESQSKANSADAEATRSIEEALARLKNDPEWEDVGTALSALFKNQQQMQVQMSLLSSGYSRGMAGLSSYFSSGLGSTASTSYGGVSSLLGSSIFGDMQL